MHCRCFEVIDWKKKYGKYKPRRQPGKCLGCDEKTVSQAYHQLCPPCSSSRRVCAKCMLAPPAPPGPEELEARATLAQVRSRAFLVSLAGLVQRSEPSSLSRVRAAWLQLLGGTVDRTPAEGVGAPGLCL